VGSPAPSCCGSSKSRSTCSAHPLGWSTRAWVVACFAVLGLVSVNLRRTTLRRKAVSLAGAITVVLTTVLGVNAIYGL